MEYYRQPRSGDVLMKNSFPYLILLSLISMLSACVSLDETYDPTFTSTQTNKPITRLDLSHQNLTELPANITSQANLKVVNLTNNPKLNWHKTLKQLCNLPQIKTLILDDNQLTSLPDAIQDCKQLTGLSLAKNPMLDVAVALTKVSKHPLNYLNLSRNQLTTLPRELANFVALNDLRLSHNQIHETDAFSSLVEVKSLRTLWLDNNELTSLPDSLYLLSQVHYLYLDHNHLSTLPINFLQLRAQAVWLGHNEFKEIPDNLAYSYVLMAFLNNNHIEQLGKNVEAGKLNLRGIILDYNHLSPVLTHRARKQFINAFIYQDDNQTLAQQ